jgi:Mrp family chromosome partitioning ATPase
LQIIEQPRTTGQSEGALSYLQAIRHHKMLVAAVTLLALLGSIIWLSVRSPSYEASAKVLVSAVQDQEEGLFLGLDVLRESVDPTRTVQTAASLVESREAAIKTAERLGDGWTADSVLSAIQVSPEGESSILSITATAESKGDAVRLANAFTAATIAVRSEEIQRQAEIAARALEGRLQDSPATGEDLATLEARLDQLEALSEGGDPTLSVAQLATPPGSASGAGTPLVIVLALLAGLALGSAAAVLRDLAARHVRDEEDAQRVWPLPVLARVPPLSRGSRDGAMAFFAQPVVREAYRGLAVQLEQGSGNGRTVMVTSPSTGDGKTTSAVNLATSLAADGCQVLLMDLDLRKPDVARTLAISTANTVKTLAESDEPISNFLTKVPHVENLTVFATTADTLTSGDAAINAVGGKLLRLLAEANQVAPYVVIDTPPIGEVSDGLRVAHAVDDVVIVARPGHTDRASLGTVREMLDQIGVAARGFVVIGAAPRVSSYYEYGRAMREQAGREAARSFDAPPDRLP